MRNNIALRKWLLILAGGNLLLCALPASSSTERENACLEWVDWHIKLIEDNSEILRKSVVSYLPYSDQEKLTTGQWDALYRHILERCEHQYDVFFAYVYDDHEIKFFVLKGNQVFSWIPYLKVPGSQGKWTLRQWIAENDSLRESLLREIDSRKPDPVIISEIVGKCKRLNKATWEIDEYSNPIQSQAAASIVKVMEHFWKLQPSVKGFDSNEISLLDDYFASSYMGTSKEFFFYGMNSNMFGVSMGMFVTALSSPSSEVGYLMLSLIDYAANPRVNKEVPETLFYIDVKENPFIKKYWDPECTTNFIGKEENKKQQD